MVNLWNYNCKNKRSCILELNATNVDSPLNTTGDIEEHTRRMHKAQHNCGMCEFSTDDTVKLIEHEKGG